MEFFLDAEALRPSSVFKLPGYQVWCGSMIQDANRRCHLFFSMWPESSGFDGWLTASKIAYAYAPEPDAAYEFHSIVLPGSGIAGAWDRDVTHNPTVLKSAGKLYLYYTGNFGDGQMWTHRNHQQVGVAYSETPTGPWRRSPAPIISHPGAVMVSNPSVCEMADGRFLMIYKWVAGDGEPPFYGPVKHGTAFSDSPLGPFVVAADDLFSTDGIFFPGEDPFVFRVNRRYYCLLKDNGANYSKFSRALILFESENGIDWKITGPALPRSVKTLQGNDIEMFRLERPQLSFCSGQTRLFCAVKPKEEVNESFSINLKVTSTIWRTDNTSNLAVNQ